MKQCTGALLASALLGCLLCGCAQDDVSSTGKIGQTDTAVFSVASTEQTCQTDTTVSTRIERTKSMKVVILGDSNTEYGHITNALNTILVQTYGDCGSGFVTFSRKSAQPQTSRLNIDVGSWESGDVTTENNWWGTEQIDAAFGLNITSEEPGAVVTAKFRDPGFTLYYLMQPEGGTLRLTLDGKEIAVLETAADRKSTAKYSYQGKGGDTINRLKIQLVSGKATLFGMETLTTETVGGVVHNWGNAGANSQHYYHGDKAIFESALCALEPTHVVYLIGTNDGVDNATFKKALIEQVKRIQEAVPQAKVMIASTFDIDYANSKDLMQEYLAHAYPEAAAETGATYWNMHAFFGPYNPEQMQDGWHCNAAGGEKIARELYKQLLAISS